MDAGTPHSAEHNYQSPESESYGFALYICVSVLWVVWILWAASPEWLLLKAGIEWFPHRFARIEGFAHRSEWAYLLIAWSLVLVLTVYAVFLAINVRSTPPLDSSAVIMGESSSIVYR